MVEFGHCEGRFQVRSELGSGAVGVVYRALNLDTGREVAVKVLRAAPTPDRLDRFRREGAIAASLQHPGIVQLLAAGTSEGRPYLEYELVSGANSLQDVLPHATQARALEILRDAARALGHAHEAGVLHRDVKPDNILIDLAGQVRVTDFGIATAKGFESLTRTGELVGTPLYMAPEQMEGRRAEYSPATDVWALGVILYEILTGRPPFEVETFIQLLDAVKSGSVEPPHLRTPEVDPALEAICLRALSRDPSERPATGTALADELAAQIRSSETKSSDSAPGVASRAPLAVSALAASLLVVAGVAYLVGSTAGLGPDPSPDLASASAPTVTPRASPDASPEDVVAELERRVSSNDAAAMRELARIYFRGVGRPPDVERAKALLRRACELDDFPSMESLGRLLQADPQGSPASLEESLKWLRKSAEGGESGAMVALGFALRTGRGAPHNLPAARAWYQKAAQAGSSEGMNAAGRMLLAGVGGEANLAEGVAWIRRSAEQNDPLGIALLGECYQEGTGVEADDTIALKHYRRAAALGEGYAKNQLGMACQFGGLGFNRDIGQALTLYRESAKAGDGAGMANLGFLLMRGWGTAEDPARAAVWFRRSIATGSTRGLVYLGFLYGNGLGVKQDFAAEQRLYEQGARAGDRGAMYNLGTVFENGKGGREKNFPLAFKWYRRAAELGEASGALALGNLYSLGRGTEEDPVEGRRWYRKAHELGNPLASLRLGQFLFAGRGGERDQAAGIQLIKEAADQGSGEGAQLLGEIYLNGEGVPKDEALGVEWLKRAASRGNERARRLLNER